MGLSSTKDEYGRLRENLGLADILGFDLQDTPIEMVQKEVGKGRVVFIPMNVLPVGKGDTQHTPLPDDQKMYGRGEFPTRIKDAFDALPAAVEWAAAGELSAKMSGPYTVEMTTMEQKANNLQAIHLVNYNVNMNLDGKVTPAQNISVRFRVPDGKSVAKVTFGSPLTKTKEISYQQDGKYININIPSFEVYSLATVYFK